MAQPPLVHPARSPTQTGSGGFNQSIAPTLTTGGLELREGRLDHGTASRRVHRPPKTGQVEVPEAVHPRSPLQETPSRGVLVGYGASLGRNDTHPAVAELFAVAAVAAMWSPPLYPGERESTRRASAAGAAGWQEQKRSGPGSRPSPPPSSTSGRWAGVWHLSASAGACAPCLIASGEPVPVRAAVAAGQGSAAH